MRLHVDLIGMLFQLSTGSGDPDQSQLLLSTQLSRLVGRLVLHVATCPVSLDGELLDDLRHRIMMLFGAFLIDMSFDRIERGDIDFGTRLDGFGFW